MSEKLFFGSVKEHCGSYFVEYRPPHPGFSFATLSLVFLDKFEIGEVTKLMEFELHRWLERYSVPLMVTAFDDKDNCIRAGNGEDYHLVGWLAPHTNTVECSWKLDDLTTFLKTAPLHTDWRKIYRDVSFRTETQVKDDQEKFIEERRRQKFILKVVFTLWLVVIPVGLVIFEHFGPHWVGLIALIYSFWEAWRTWQKINGTAKPSQAELEENEKQRKMEHYYYHCERNPVGFSRLKVENFENEISENTRIEAKQIAKASSPDGAKRNPGLALTS